jgi:hypothetical protein
MSVGHFCPHGSIEARSNPDTDPDPHHCFFYKLGGNFNILQKPNPYWKQKPGNSFKFGSFPDLDPQPDESIDSLVTAMCCTEPHGVLYPVAYSILR